MNQVRSKVERALEAALFSSRWLLAPFYLGMVVALGIVLVVFAREVYGALAHITEIDPEGAIILSLSLIDLSLTGNLLLIVMFSGYENFVSKLNIEEHEDRPWKSDRIDRGRLLAVPSRVGPRSSAATESLLCRSTI